MNPISIFPNNRKAAWFWCAVSLFLVIALVAQGYFLNIAHLTREKVIVMDGAGTFNIAPAESFEKAEKMQEYIVRLATSAFLVRNPNGLDNSILFRQIYHSSIHNKAKRILNIDSGNFKKNKIYQQIIGPRFKILKTKPDTVIALAEGQLQRTWNFHGSPEIEILWFKMKFLLTRNLNLTENGRLPLVVKDFKIRTYTENPDSQ